MMFWQISAVWEMHIFLPGDIYGFWVLGFGFWVLGFGFWVLGFGFWVLGFGFWVLIFAKEITA
ncbi:hypothetical protein [Nitrosomonas aestuarii]|uniref:hypothetical protein n=1 Tax=Nitrosomonas aestuarii TaxID=52441 RepID=UPI0015E67C75|nr:hypothetical protein [Nitrosomonas aestuarii]